MPYKLSASLHAHSSDVRGVASPSNDLVLSVSRDKTAVAWAKEEGSTGYKQEAVFQAGDDFVNAVTYIPPSTGASKGYLVAGGTDKKIRVFPLDSPSTTPKFELVGHGDNVCALNASGNGVIISGSWDKTARVWQDFQLKYELKGHTQSVWSVLVYNEANEEYLTGSADNTIKLWVGSKVKQTFSGHTSSVRGLAKLPDGNFASCSNDATIIVWDIKDGSKAYTLNGHTSFVYSIAVLPSGEIVSSGEDRTVRIWRGFECIQTIVHPAISVWTVSTMPNGDIVTGASDKFVRVFSETEERWAPAEELKAYDDTIANQTLSSEQIGDVKKSDLPGVEALSNPGKKAGEVKMVRNGFIVEAHQWDFASNSWQKIGEVVDAVGSGRKQLHEGREYDYVFDVDIQDGVPPLKLPYNANENPYAAAQRFLAANDLPMEYVDQVVQFIEKNTSGVTIGQEAGPADPFTGATRYQPAAVSAAAGSGSDPFTGGSRYAPASSATVQPTALSDPFTGGTRYAPSSSQAPLQPAASSQTPTVIPMRNFHSFDKFKAPEMRNKILTLNAALTEPQVMRPEELESVTQVLDFLVNMNSPSAEKISASHLQNIIQVLGRWPPASKFPIIDLARLVIAFRPETISDPAQASQFFVSLLEKSGWDNLQKTPVSTIDEKNIILALRTLVNAFQARTVKTGGPWIEKVLAEIKKVPYQNFAKPHRVIVATVLFNVSCARFVEPLSASNSTSHLSIITTVLSQETTDAEAIYRTLCALGNSLVAPTPQGYSLSPNEINALREAVAISQSRFTEERFHPIYKDLGILL